jgi:SSS family solute:Na+ symporter
MLEDLFTTQFTGWDWAIVTCYLLGTIVVGLYANRFIRGLDDFLVAGRTLRVPIAIATMTGTELGLVTVMYSAEEGFRNGISAIHIGIIEGVCLFGIGLSGAIIYGLRAKGVRTIPEFYGERFGKTVQVVGATILVLAGILNMGLFLRAGANFVMGLTGLGIDPASPEGLALGLGLKLVMTGMLALVLFYTTLGGMVSVVITDYVQFIVLGLGMAVITVFAVKSVGWNDLFTRVVEIKGPGGIDPRDAPSYGWSYIIYMFLISFCGGAVWQTAVMRALSTRSPELSKKLYMWSGVSYFARRTFPMLWGACALVFLANQGLLGLFNGQGGTVSPQFAMPVFLAKVIPAGLIGVIAAGMLAAFMSTHDSYLLCWSSVITQDIIGPLRKEFSERGRILVTRIGIVVIGIFLLVWGLWYQMETSLWTYMAITGTIYFAGALPVLVGGLYWKKASSRGALLSLLLGLLSVISLLPWQKIYPDADWVNTLPHRLALANFLICAVGMIAGSLFFPDPPRREASKEVSS